MSKAKLPGCSLSHPPSKMIKIPFYSLFLLSLFSFANAYTWKFTSQPRQCQSLSVAVTGSGHPPYNITIIPTGPSPLKNNVEVRKILNIPFNESGNTLTFQLTYPENSSFVAVVSSFTSHVIFSPSLSRVASFRSVTVLVLAQVVPALRSLFSNRQTRVATIPPKVSKPLGYSMSIPQ